MQFWARLPQYLLNQHYEVQSLVFSGSLFAEIYVYYGYLNQLKGFLMINSTVCLDLLLFAPENLLSLFAACLMIDIFSDFDEFSHAWVSNQI